MRLSGKVALVTGAARGIGAATAKLFSAEGAKVIVADIDEDGGRRCAKEIPNAHYVRLNVSREEDWKTAVDETVKQFGRLDSLVNNAGIYRTCPIEETSVDLFVRTFEINQLGVFLGMKAAVGAMKAHGGSIVNLSSTSGLRGNQNSIAYGSTKWAVRGMTKIAAVEFGPYGIRVNSVHPGLIDTPMNQEEMGAETIARVGASVPMHRPGRAQEVAELILFLASDASSYCSGGEYTVDGAMSAGVIRQKFRDREAAAGTIG